MTDIKVVGKRFAPEQFRQYVAGVKLVDGFTPDLVVIHNTAAPSLKTRPQGITDAQIRNWETYYEGKGWSGAPHIFVDDNEQGIVVFNPLDRRGVHSPSFNGDYGIEMLGDFETESPTEGRGAKVVANGAAAAAILLEFRGLKVSGDTVKLHREDPKTDHACPGSKVSKPFMLQKISEASARLVSSEKWTVKDSTGKVVAQGVDVGLLGTGLVRAVAVAAGGGVTPDNAAKTVTVHPISEK